MYSKYLYDKLNNYLEKTSNRRIMKYIINDLIHLLSYDLQTKKYVYSVGKKSDTVSFVEQRPNIVDIKCSCCDVYYDELPYMINCEKVIAVLFYHNFVLKEYQEIEKYKLTNIQRERLENNTNLEKDVIITQAIKFRLDDKVYEMINQERIMEKYLDLYLYCMSNDDRYYLFSLYNKKNIVIPSELFIESILHTSTDLTEDFFINNFDNIKHMDIIKNNNPQLFDFTKQSIAFKMFLMMKGV